MSKENVKKFYEMLNSDKALAEELHNAVKAVVLQFADKQGLAFTAEDLAEFEKESRKLSDEELDQVSAATVTITDARVARSVAWIEIKDPVGIINLWKGRL